MKSHYRVQYKLIVTVALKKEAPKEWFKERGIPVYSLSALKGGVLKSHMQPNGTGILFVVTGAGLQASEEAAYWILDHLTPNFVVNIGTCGLTDYSVSLGQWLRPHCVSNESGQEVLLDTRLPLPHSEKILDIPSLLSVSKSQYSTLPSSWRRYKAIDQECYAQARVFQNGKINFHCLKMGSDYSDNKTFSHFNESLDRLTQGLKRLFTFADDQNETRRVSVIIPVYNRQHTVKRAVDSVLGQSVQPEEVIVVDDGSTDKTSEMLESYGDTIRCIILTDNKGVSRARNVGLKHAMSEWIAFLDSDDAWYRDKLKNQIEYLKRYPFYEILQSHEIWIRDGVRVNGCKHHKKTEGWIWELSLHRCLISPSGVLVKKALVERYGLFPEDFPVCEDYDLWLKIVRYHPVGLEPSLSIIKYGGHSDQLSRKYPAMDYYRVQTLFNLLKEEGQPAFQEKIIPVLIKKLHILINGAHKRQKFKQVESYKKLLQWIDSHDWQGSSILFQPLEFQTNQEIY